MSIVKLSQWEMMLLEAARSHGFVDEEIIHKLRSENTEAFLDVEGGKFDFTHLFDLSKNDPHTLETAIRDGYQIKFTTFNGIKFLLNKRYDIQADRDYQINGDSLDRVPLKDHALSWVRQAISKNWRIVELEKRTDSGDTIVRFELVNTPS
ncbi:hypothetical protein BRE01_32720 [Brevibacillus reuszeri]|uniref:Uncharacterized protein n=1 Tax=Brevibacillus reuszeri TaxID=54915 RepID=A0A0K9YY35_9BACL|nr:hypothetical protein [Brevibacillus reuszeri]KNB73603.1 hypothetical protein ADS79_06585 [Brevibacillus reuszeri]MED1858594.1 hypothetical protein [Brevibacillus reuszeri]GED69570.1 hypothetical protein BRE01_32720 [Brevibacillus reuszeri]